MTCNSLTWQFLPPQLQEPLLQGVISQAEAADLWDLTLLCPDDWINWLPPHLQQVARRVWLFRMRVDAMLPH